MVEPPSQPDSHPEPSTVGSTLPTLLASGSPTALDEQKATIASSKIMPVQSVTQTRNNMIRSNSLERAGSALANAGRSMSLQRSDSLPVDYDNLRHAASMPTLHDTAAERPWCGLWTMKQFVGLVLGVLLFILFEAAGFIRSYPKANDMLAVTALMACFWAFEVIPIYMTSLFPVVFVPFMGINSTANVCNAYFNEVSMLFVGVFIVDVAMEQVELPRRIALKLLTRIGVVKPGALLASFMALSWALSIVTSSIVTTLMITPVAISLMNAAEEQARDAESQESTESDTARIRSVQHLSEGLLLGIAYSATTGSVTMISASPANGVLGGNMFAEGIVTYGTWFLFALPVSLVNLGLIFAVLYVRYARHSRTAPISVDVLYSEYEDLLSKVGHFSRDELFVGMTLLLMIGLLIISPWAIEPHVTYAPGATLLAGATLSVMCGVILFLLPSQVRPGEAILTWKVVHEKFDIGIILLIGGGFGLASGFANSGLDIVLGDMFDDIIPAVHPMWLNFIVIIIISTMTQILGCTATASIMLPILASACKSAVISPLQLMLPATVACSFAFALPMATPPNVIALAMSSGLMKPLRVRDFLCNGLPLTIVASFVGAIITYHMGQAIFGTRLPLSEEVCRVTNCMWVDIPGTVQGHEVTSQACMVLDEFGEAVCKLWNTTLVNIKEVGGVPPYPM